MLHNPEEINKLLNQIKELTSERDLYKTIADNTYDWEVFRNSEGKVVYINKSFERITGFLCTDILEGRVSEKDVVHPEDWPYVAERLKDSISAREVLDLEFRIICKNGMVKYINLYAKPVFSENGTFIGIRTSARDISEQQRFNEFRKMHVELKEQSRKFKSYIDNSPMAIFVANNFGQYIFANKAVCSLLEYSISEILRMSIPDILPQSCLQKGLRHFECLNTQGISNDFEIKLLTKSGKEIDVVLDAVKISDTEFMAYVKDITELKRMEERLKNQLIEYQRLSSQIASVNEEYLATIETLKAANKLALENEIKQKKYEKELLIAKEKAEESNCLKTSFLQNMSHEIRTPMNGIIGFAEMLKRKELSLEKRDFFIDLVIGNSNQLLSIVNDIITISVIETGQVELRNEEFSLNQMMEDLYREFNGIAVKSGLTLHYSTTKQNEPFLIVGDRDRIYQTFQALLANAIKFTPVGEVRFGYSIKESFLEFFVQDTGIGIESTMYQSIFERFRQVETSDCRKYGGNGLGLAIAKGLVDKMGGQIWLTSEVGVGSVFYFTIPYISATREKDDDSIDNNRTIFKRPQVLIAEDEDVNFLYIEELLSEFPVEIIHAVNGLEAVQFFDGNPEISMVLMDIKMPFMNGYEAAIEIKKRCPGVTIIAQTAYALDHEILKYKDVFDDYIVKPIDAYRFLDVIRKRLPV